jgi:hypothetical protein
VGERASKSSFKIIMVIMYASPAGDLGITPKRLERISSFDLNSEPEKIKLRKKSKRDSWWGGRKEQGGGH